MSELRKAGDFPNKSVVEYATVRVEVPHRLVPANLQDQHYGDNEIVQGLYASPRGRLTYKTLYLDSEELAERFVEKLHLIFKERAYSGHYKLKLSVETTTKTTTATNSKIKHSALVAEHLSSK
ncbi:MULTISPECIES: hypothetical protein [Pseudomonas]|uniref:hypothetical protein n=1 Tax=Pseudomonas TaxID=286 RepID=UPI0030027436